MLCFPENFQLIRFIFIYKITIWDLRELGEYLELPCEVRNFLISETMISQECNVDRCSHQVDLYFGANFVVI